MFEPVKLEHHNKCYLKISCSYKFPDSQYDENLLQNANFEMIPIDEEKEEDDMKSI